MPNLDDLAKVRALATHDVILNNMLSLIAGGISERRAMIWALECLSECYSISQRELVSVLSTDTRKIILVRE